MRTEDDAEDSRGLLSERWMGEKEDRKARHRPWEMWGIAFICVLSGMALGALLSHGSGNAKESTCVPDHSEPALPSAPSVPAAPFGLDLPVTFQKNEYFEKDGGPEADSIWETLLPKGRGFVQVDQDGKAIPHDGEPSDLSQTKVVSVFHQLHCLNNLRKSLLASVDDPTTFQYMVPTLAHHWKHCFDYLRQALMCNADVTLENLEKSTVDDRSLASVDGWGTEHVCRNWGKLYEWAETNRATDDGGID